MNVSAVLTKDYENETTLRLKKNKPKNKPNLPEGKIDAKCVFTKDYERNDIFAVPENKPNSNPIKPNFLKIPDNFSSQLKVVIEVFGPARIAKSPPFFYPVTVEYTNM